MKSSEDKSNQKNIIKPLSKILNEIINKNTKLGKTGINYSFRYK